jgi:hypothetical protein
LAESPADPRTADSIVLAGERAGERLVNVGPDPITIAGRQILVPRPAPGIAEFMTVALAEAEANRAIPRIAENLDTRGEVPYQPNEALVLEGRALAGSVATSAAVGLEAFANHHIHRSLGAEPTWEDRDPFGLPIYERYRDVLPVVLDVRRPTQEPWWSTLRRVTALAVEVRHPRPVPRPRGGLEGVRSLEQRLFGGEYRGAAAMMLAAFEHFSPGWVPERKLKELPPAPPAPFDLGGTAPGR